MNQHLGTRRDWMRQLRVGWKTRLLRQFHLWVALILCLPLILLGLSGSILVFVSELRELLNPPPSLRVETGMPHTVTEMIAAAQANVGRRYTPFVYEPPRAPEQPATVRFIALSEAAAEHRLIELLVDPVSLRLVINARAAPPDLIRVLIRFHGNLLMGPVGRNYVGWLGIAMLALVVSGLILWWPRSSRWRAAFLIRRGARGLRLHRDMHGAVGIWTLVVYSTVIVSGIYLVFPQTMGAVIRTLFPSHDSGEPAPIIRAEGTQQIDVDRAIAVALADSSGARLRSILLPLRAEQPYRVSMMHPNDSAGAQEIVTLVSPGSGKLMRLTDPARFNPTQRVLAWQRTIHFGQGFGWGWRILVCLSGLLPIIFAYTGISMWLIRHRTRRRGVRRASQRWTFGLPWYRGWSWCDAAFVRFAGLCDIAHVMMVGSQRAPEGWSWRCPHCHGSVTEDTSSFRCSDCGRSYPVIAGIPLLVREPANYVRSELQSLARTLHDAERRGEWLDRIGRDADLPKASLDRHRDVNEAEIARLKMFLDLLKPAASTQVDREGSKLAPRRSGWTTDALLPYFLRDWTGTPELDAVTARIGAALKRVLGDPSGKSVVIAGCGASGLLAAMPPEFDRVLGFDLTLSALAAARHLLDGNSLTLALPRAINQAGQITLRGYDGRAPRSHRKLVAMDAFATAFPDGSVDCVVTAFLIDLIPEPRRLAREIHRILARDGVWVNYGPSGSLTSFQRFDEVESAAFLETVGFKVVGAESFRTTYLDLSRDCPAWSFQNHICYLMAARKDGDARDAAAAMTPALAELSGIIPRHFPGATLVHRQPLGRQSVPTTILRHGGVPGRTISFEVTDETARILALVDDQRTVSEIADLLNREMMPVAMEQTIEAFIDYFQHGLLGWRDRCDGAAIAVSC
jgi:uncharacterized iron-regulated membrane protein/SAM-dependent methyltransferase/uncharacterized protein YbaR (Trm112 family)